MTSMDWWRKAELGLPLMVTVALAWWAIRVETGRSREDRLETWRYERTQRAVESALEQMLGASEHAKLYIITGGSDDRELLQNVVEVAHALAILSRDEILHKELRDELEAQHGVFPEESEEGASDTYPKRLYNWSSTARGALLGAHHSTASAWAKEGEHWERYLASKLSDD
ncbi:hypothetical protein ACTXKH_19560 [Brachybacterium tyrofermentans]|uniref:hypothetical protein n=1 Tax=Brachybacterium tyrofermentans TaxID=47848 RepID=UPI003FD38082